MKRKHLLLTLLLALFAPWAANAQTQTLTVYDEGGTTKHSYIPFCGRYAHYGTSSQFIIPATELTDLAGGSISKLTFYSSSDNKVFDETLTVYLKEVNYTTFGEPYTWEDWSSLTQVYSSSFELSNYQMEIEFDTPFGYNGGNLLIGFLIPHEENGGYQMLSWYGENQTGVTALYSYYLNNGWLDHSDSFLPKTTFTYETCQKPTGLTVNDVTNSSVTFSWTENGSATHWQIDCCNNSNFTCDLNYYIDVNNTPSYSITQWIDPGTTYYARVRAVCGTDWYSEWSDPVSFTTRHNPVAVGDSWNDNFEGYTCGWDFVNGTQPNQWVWGTATNNGGTHALYISNDGGTSNDYTNNSLSVVYATKQFSFAQSGYYRFEYDWKNNGEGITGPFDRLRVALVPGLPELTPGIEFPGLDSQNLPTGWMALDGGHWLSGYEAWQNANEEVYIETGTYTMVFVWRNDGSGGWSPAAVDNVNILSRRAPFDLTCSHKSSNAVTIAWTSGTENQTNWQVVYSEDPNFDPNSATDILSTQVPEVRLEGLIALNTYYVYVRGNCGSGFSDWSERFEFTTEAICDEATGLQVVEGSQTCQGATIQWNDNGDDFTVMAGEMNFTNYYLFDFLGDQFPAAFTHNSPNYGFVKAFDDRNCAKSNNGGQHNTTAEMVLNVTIPIESDLSFSARISSEQNYDKAYFSIDGTVQEGLNGISGEGLWYGYGFTLPAGSHTLRWYYVKDPSVDRNDDCFYVTDISISSYVVEEWTSYEHASSPYTITGLEANTEYWTKVIRNCTADNHSSDGYIADFRTLPCQAPTDLEVIALTTEYFRFQYCGLEGGVYQYAIDKADSEPHWYNGNISSPLIADGCPSVGYPLVGFEPNTDYVIRVRRICGEDDYSESATATFRTLDQCAAIPSLSFYYSPYSWNFEDVEGIPSNEYATENNLPMCWDYINQSTDVLMKYYPIVSYDQNAAHQGQNHLLFGSLYLQEYADDPQPQYAIMPPMQDVSVLKMSFYAKTVESVGNQVFHIGVIEGTDASTFTVIEDFTTTDEYTEYTVSFESYTGNGKRIAIKMDAANNVNTPCILYVDDITVELNCDTPTDLIASNVTSTTADLGWTGSPAAESYTVRYREINVGEPTFTEGFENGLGDWTFYSANQANDIGGTALMPAGISQLAAHSGSNSFGFSSYASTNQGEDYWQSLTSPEFSLSGPSVLRFYYQKYMERDESLYVGYITDLNNPQSATYVSMDIVPTGLWQCYTLDLPADAKKVFFSYYGENNWLVFIDDITIEPAAWTEVSGITNEYATLSNLTMGTEYDVQVTGSCNHDEWSNTVTFTTQGCTYPVPSTWDFDDVAEAHLPSCWTRMGSSSNWPMVNTYFAYSGSRDLEFYHASADDETFIAVMPAFAADLNTLSVEFYGKQTYGDEPAYIEAGYMTDLNDVESFVNAKTFYMTDTYEKYTAFFNNAPTDGFIAFKTTYLNQRFAIVIDDVTVKELECEAVTNLQVTETGSKYITLNWDGQDDADFYIYYTNLTTQERLRTPGAVRPPYTLEDLSVYTTYQIEVTAECNVVNSNPYNLDLVATMYVETTYCPAPTDVTVDIIDATSATVSWTGSSEAESYMLGYRSVAVAGDNPILAQGFEDVNDMGGWYIGNGDATCAEICTEAAYNGDNGFKLTACPEGNPYEGLYIPDVLNIPNVQITGPTVLKFYYRKNASSSMVSLVFAYSFGYGTGFGSDQFNLPLTDEWQLFTVELPADVYQVQITYYDPQRNPDAGVYIDDITISPVAQPTGEWQNVYDIETTSTTLTDLVLNTEYEVRVTSDCSYGGDISVVFFTMEEPTAVQTLNLSAGVNWVSFYVETTLDDLKTALLGELNNASGIKITSQSNGFTSWNGSSWRGTLNTIDVSQMYVIEVPATCAISLEAMPIDPAEHPITIVNGINWIGFPLSADMTLTNAFNGFAVNGDKVSSLNDGNANYQGSWSGGLSTLQPGQGYKYEVTTTGQRTLVFPSGAKKAKPFIPMGK